jgi:hypothetical protein
MEYGRTRAFDRIAAQSETGNTGNGGSVQVNAGSLSIANARTISASTFGYGAAGNVTTQVGGTLSTSGDGAQSTTTAILATTGLFGKTDNTARYITVNAGSLLIATEARPRGQAMAAASRSAPRGRLW